MNWLNLIIIVLIGVFLNLLGFYYLICFVDACAKIDEIHEHICKEEEEK